MRTMPGFEFWPDSLSYVDTDLGHVRGHRQVTDAHLVSVAAGRADSVLATLDEGLVQSAPRRTIIAGRTPLAARVTTLPGSAAAPVR